MVLAALATVLVWKHRAEKKRARLRARCNRLNRLPAKRNIRRSPVRKPCHQAQYKTLRKLPVPNGQSANQAGANLANNPANKPRSRQPLSDSELAALLERRLTPAMRRAINEQLQPGGSPPRERQGPYGSFLDFSDRAASVMIAVIDDDGNTVITDVMQALPEPGRIMCTRVVVTYSRAQQRQAILGSACVAIVRLTALCSRCCHCRASPAVRP